MLVTMEGHDGWYADLDELPKLDSASEPTLRVRGERVDAAALKSTLSFWWTTQCHFYLVDADVIRSSDEESMPAMLSLQELRDQRPSSVRRELVTMPDVIGRKFEVEWLAVSHRCASAARATHACGR